MTSTDGPRLDAAPDDDRDPIPAGHDDGAASPDAPEASDEASAHAVGRGWFARGLVVATLVGLVVRVGYVLLVRDDPVQADGMEYYLQGRALFDRGDIVNIITQQPTARHPPLWPVVLGI